MTSTNSDFDQRNSEAVFFNIPQPTVSFAGHLLMRTKKVELHIFGLNTAIKIIS